MTTKTTKTVATIPGTFDDFQLESDGTVWFRPSIGDRAGQRVVVTNPLRIEYVHNQARFAGVKFDPETKTYGF